MFEAWLEYAADCTWAAGSRIAVAFHFQQSAPIASDPDTSAYAGYDLSSSSAVHHDVAAAVTAAAMFPSGMFGANSSTDSTPLPAATVTAVGYQQPAVQPAAGLNAADGGGGMAPPYAAAVSYDMAAPAAPVEQVPTGVEAPAPYQHMGAQPAPQVGASRFRPQPVSPHPCDKCG